MTSESRPRRYPLHTTISAAFAGLVLVFGAGLVGFNYMETRKITLLAADRQLERIAGHLRLSVSELYAPAQDLVDISSKGLLPDHGSFEERLRSAGFLAEALRVNRRISSIFVGYEDGEFMLLRDVRHPLAARDGVEIPAGSSFVAHWIEWDDAAPVEQRWIYLDAELNILERQTEAWTGYDARERDWYRGAFGQSGQFVSERYAFFHGGAIGVTIARRLATGHGVVGVDLALADLSIGLAEQRITPSSRILVLEPDGRIIVRSDAAESGTTLARLDELDDPVYDALSRLFGEAVVPGRTEFSVAGRVWVASVSELPVRRARGIALVNLVPRDELLAGAKRVRDQSVLVSLGMLVVALIVVVAVSRHLSGSLRTLAREAREIRELRLDTPLTVHSRIEEVDDLADAMSAMKSSLQRFLEISRALSAEKNFDRLQRRILDEARRVTGAEAGSILLRAEDGKSFEVAILQGPAGEVEVPESVSTVIDDTPGCEQQVVLVEDAGAESRYDLTGVRARVARAGCELLSLLSVPLRTQSDTVIGSLQLVNPRRKFHEETVPYIEALSSSAAVALDNRRLFRAQKELLESFIHVVAGAIDAKSPYTGGHCQRVPVVARMLAEAAHAAETGPFADFKLSDDEWYELHLASWLHDCGKVTTPEYVVDKATKLETIYDRIHEVRTRFEVLLRDAEIACLEGEQEPGADRAALRRELARRRAEIRDDFAFLARCNQGGEFLPDEHIERIRSIGSQTWKRHLDDSLGLSPDETNRRSDRAAPDLPVAEPLLADRPEHIVPRQGDGGFAEDPHGFRMNVPEHMYNRGEIHNLSIRRGTLTEEERFKINEHVVETIRMLGRLPFPREMQNVVGWAGNHHEKLDGTGYPRRLGMSDLSVPDRIMAVADVFEALTATDRPYMQPKKLSQAIGIMRSMCGDGHLCPEVLELFLGSEIHLRYAADYLQSQQIDDQQTA